jgi:WD40 repeat protein
MLLTLFSLWSLTYGSAWLTPGIEPVLVLSARAGAFSVAYRPDGGAVAAATRAGEVQVWDSRTGKELLTLRGHTKPVSSVAFSPDGKVLASAGCVDHTIRLWDATSGKEFRSWEVDGEDVWHVAFSPDGKTMASASANLSGGDLRLWDAATGKEVRRLGGRTVKAVFGLAFSPDGKSLATGDADRKVRLWDVATGKEQATYSCAAVVFCLAFSPDGKAIAVGTDVERLLADFGAGQIEVWDIEKNKRRTTITAYPNDEVRSLAWSPDGKFLVSARRRGKTIDLWGATPPYARKLSFPSGESVSSLAIAPDGRRLVSGSHLDRAVKIWELPRLPEAKNE